MIWIPITLMVLLALVGIWGQVETRIIWNKGICKKNGLPWKHVDTCTNGFDCLYRAGEETVWLNWPMHE